MTVKACLLAGTCLLLAACAEGRQRSLVSRSLDSGVTSSNGGGDFTLHNEPNLEITDGKATITGIRNSPTTPCRTNPRLAGC